MMRLPHAPTQRVDRAGTLAFTWQGRRLRGLDGESGNTLVNVDGECNVRAETTLLQHGQRVTAQNSWGPVEKDRLAFIDRLDRLMPAGFLLPHAAQARIYLASGQ